MQLNSYLVLEGGEVFQGRCPQQDLLHENFPGKAGEVVFNTSHSGYEEIATDPSYFSQIVVMTAPMMGNYGEDDSVWESNQIYIEGFICLQIQESGRESSWLQKLASHQVPILCEVDTRKLVIRLRSQGTPWGAIVHAKDEEQAIAKANVLIRQKKDIPMDWVHLTSRKKIEKKLGGMPLGPKIGVMDFGCKENIIREIAKFCSEVIIFPSRTSSAEILKSGIQGILLSNGPGNPSDVEVAPATVKELFGKLPIFGICMGHQILALAYGAKTFKLKFGHRGSNHPIQDKLLNKIYMTSQNHGYAVDPSRLPPQIRVTQVNLNDQTLAGFYDPQLNCLGIQYHPESSPGPHEARGLFSFFADVMINKGNV